MSVSASLTLGTGTETPAACPAAPSASDYVALRVDIDGSYLMTEASCVAAGPAETRPIFTRIVNGRIPEADIKRAAEVGALETGARAQARYLVQRAAARGDCGGQPF